MSDKQDCPRYEINTVEDFLKVPEDRLPVCLSEFANFLETARSMKRLAVIAGETIGLSAEESAISAPTFVWLDDGNRNAYISLNAKTLDEAISTSEPLGES